MHGSPNNISPLSRTNAFFVYNALSNRVAAPFGTEAPRPAHVAERHPVALPPR
jgi:ectoine hydroxylase